MNFALIKALRGRLFKESLIYTVFNIINKVIPFLLLPILISYVGISGYGYYSIFMALSIFLGHVAGLNIQSVVYRRFFDKSELTYSEYVFNSILLIIISSMITFLLIFLFTFIIDEVAGVKMTLIYWAAFVAMLNNLVKIELCILRAESKPFYYGFLVLLQAVVIFAGSILLLESFDLDWFATVIAQVIACILLSIITVIYLYKNGYIKCKINVKYIKDALLYILPLIPHGIAGVTFNLSGRFFVGASEGVEATGFYTVAFQIASVISLICTASGTAWTNWLFNELKAGKVVSTKKITYIYFILIFILGVLFSLFTPFVAGLIIKDSNFKEINYIYWLIAAFVFQGGYQVIIGYLFYANQTSRVSKITVSVALISLIMNYFLVTAYGGKGAAISFCLSWLLMFFLTFFMVKKCPISPWSSR
jgi:O-antigen/teichoic acid export membrane protein